MKIKPDCYSAEARVRAKALSIVMPSMLFTSLLGSTALCSFLVVIPERAHSADLFVGQMNSEEIHNVSGNEVYTDFYVSNLADEIGRVNILGGSILTTGVGTSGVGGQSNAVGTVSVSGAGSQWNASGDTNGWTYFGYAGNATLLISDSGSVFMNRAWLAHESGSSADVTVSDSGSEWHLDGDIVIGNSGAANVTIKDGATFENSGVALGGPPYASDATGSGSLTITGSGTTWTNSAGVSVARGANATGDLTISDGAVATIANGLYAFTGATVLVTGNGTSVTIGDKNNDSSTQWFSFTGGTATVSDGAYLYSDGGYIGGSGTEVSTMSVTGPNTVWDTTQRIYVGGDNGIDGGGNGTLTISDGASVSSATIGVGMDKDSTGVVTISGSGTSVHTKPVPILDAPGNFYVGYAGDGTVTLSDSATLSVDNELRIATASGSTGTLNIGAARGLDAASAGQIVAPKVVFGEGVGSIVFNHTDSNYTFAPAMSGAGDIDFYAGKTILTGDSSGFTGTTDVNGGTLLVNNALGGDLTVHADGILGGVGSVSGVTLASGATITPGNSIGTLTVNGNLEFGSGASYEVEVDKDGHSDKIVSTGTATIDNGAILKVQAENGTDDGSTYAANTDYAILSAASLSGSFGTITENFAYLDASVAYSSTDATLTLSRANSFSVQAKTPNQHRVADIVETLGGGNDLYQAVETLPDGEPASALNQLTGEQHSNVQGVLVTNITPDRNAANQRLRTSMGGIGGSGNQVSYGFHGEADDIPLSTTLTPQMWVQAFGGWGEVGSTANTARITHQSKGFLVGMDAEIWSGWRTGVFGGYSSTNSKTEGANSSSDIDNYHAGAYVGTQWEIFDGLVDLNFGASTIWHQVETDRSVAFTGFSDHLKSDYDAATSQAFAEVGYTYELGRARLQPFAGTVLIHQWSDGFTERGGAAALSASSSDEVIGMTSLGVRGDILVGRFNGVEAALNGSATWQHALGDVDSSNSMRFASGGEAFSVAGAPIDRDAVFIETGLSFTRGSDLSIGVAYQGTYGENAREHGFKAGFKYQF